MNRAEGAMRNYSGDLEIVSIPLQKYYLGRKRLHNSCLWDSYPASASDWLPLSSLDITHMHTAVGET